MSILSLLAHGILDGLGGQLGGKMLGQPRAYILDGSLGDAHGVSTHVGDETYTGGTDVHALVELLGNLHGLAGGEAQPIRRRLLQL